MKTTGIMSTMKRLALSLKTWMNSFFKTALSLRHSIRNPPFHHFIFLFKCFLLAVYGIFDEYILQIINIVLLHQGFCRIGSYYFSIHYEGCAVKAFCLIHVVGGGKNSYSFLYNFIYHFPKQPS